MIEREASRNLLAAWASLVLLAGTSLVVLRGAVFFAMDKIARGLPAELTLERIAAQSVRTSALALATAAISAALALAILRRRQGPSRVAFATVCAALCALPILTGWPADDAYHIPDPATDRGRAALFGIFVVALLHSIVLVLAGRAVRRGAGIGTVLSRPTALALGVILAAGVPAGLSAAYGTAGSTRTVRVTVRRLLDDASFEVVSAPAGRPPRVDVITPSPDWRIDGADLPSLVLSPPSEVRFRVREEDGEISLRASAGLDITSWRPSPSPSAKSSEDDVGDARVELAVLVGGEERFAASIPLRSEPKECVWRHVGGQDGLPLSPGDEVTLRSRLISSGPSSPDPGSIIAGFGRLALERRVERPRTRSGSGSPNVVLIVIDTLRNDRLSCSGGPPGLTPAIDALAERGTLFERACSTSSWTLPSTASILSGLEPEEHGVFGEDSYFLPGAADTIAEALERAGCVTGAVSCNPLIAPERNFDQGFETFESAHSFRKSDVVMPRIRGWLEFQKDDRFFLFLHLVDPHPPLFAPEADMERAGAVRPDDLPQNEMTVYRDRLIRGEGHRPGGEPRLDDVVPPGHQEWMRRGYDACVVSADRAVADVVRELEELGLAEKTIVALTSDHGEEHFDHGLLGHGQSVYEELVHVPLILAGPGVPRGERRKEVVSNKRIAPTLARLAGAAIEGLPPSAAGGSHDLFASSDAGEATVFFSTAQGWWNGSGARVAIFGAQEGSWALHWAPRGMPWGADPTGDPGEGQVRLFDLATDPGQRVDLAASKSEEALRMRAAIEEHVRLARERAPKREAGSGAATQELLRHLGYTGDEMPR